MQPWVFMNSNMVFDDTNHGSTSWAIREETPFKSNVYNWFIELQRVHTTLENEFRGG